MRHIRIAVLGVLLSSIVLGGAFAAGQTDRDGDGKTTVGFAVMRLVDEFWEETIAGLNAAIDENPQANLELRIGDNNNDGQTTVQNVELLLAQGAEVLLVSTPDPTVAPSIMELAAAENVPVVALAVPLEGAYFITFDDYDAGRIMGEYAVQHYLENLGTVESSPLIASITHLAVDQVVGLRIDGFRDAFLEEIPGAEFIERVDGEGLRERAAIVTADILTANPDVDIIFAINDDIALGAVSAVEERGLQDEIAVFGQGGIGESSFRALAVEGSPFQATTAYSPFNYGKTTIIDYVIPLLNGESVPERINSPLELATKENASDYLRDIQRRSN